jgi:hypothetical protein
MYKSIKPSSLKLIQQWAEKKIEFYEFDKIVLRGKGSPEIITVGELAKREADKWLKKERYGGSAPLIIVDTVFSLRRKYLPMVRKILRPFYREFPEEDLRRVAKCDPSLLCERLTSSPSGNQNHPLSNISRWRNVVEIAKRFVENYGDDIDAIHEWAKNEELPKDAARPPFLRKDVIIKNLNGVGISAVQYLRMQAGIDTIKPDSRVKKAFSELGVNYRSDLEVIQICENLARGLGMRPKELDFILWYSREEACE